MNKYAPCATIVVQAKVVQKVRGRVRVVRGIAVGGPIPVFRTEERNVRGD